MCNANKELYILCLLPTTCESRICIVIQNLRYIITLPTDVLTPNGATPSSDEMLNTALNIVLSNFVGVFDDFKYVCTSGGLIKMAEEITRDLAARELFARILQRLRRYGYALQLRHMSVMASKMADQSTIYSTDCSVQQQCVRQSDLHIYLGWRQSLLVMLHRVGCLFVDHDDGWRHRFLCYLSFVWGIHRPSVTDEIPLQWTSKAGSHISYSRVWYVSTRWKSQHQPNNDWEYDYSVFMNYLNKMITVGVRGARVSAMRMACIGTESVLSKTGS